MTKKLPPKLTPVQQEVQKYRLKKKNTPEALNSDSFFSNIKLNINNSTVGGFFNKFTIKNGIEQLELIQKFIRSARNVEEENQRYIKEKERMEQRVEQEEETKLKDAKRTEKLKKAQHKKAIKDLKNDTPSSQHGVKNTESIFDKRIKEAEEELEIEAADDWKKIEQIKRGLFRKDDAISELEKQMAHRFRLFLKRYFSDDQLKEIEDCSYPADEIAGSRCYVTCQYLIAILRDPDNVNLYAEYAVA